LHNGGEDYFLKQDRKEFDLSDQNQIIQRAVSAITSRTVSQPQASQGFPFALEIIHGVVLIDVVSLQEASIS